MTSALDRSGYRLGSGFSDPNSNKFLLTIPKNASSFLSGWAGENGWQIDNHSNRSIAEIIVVMRDPVERWVSGIAQYINTYILHPYGPNGPVFPGEPITEYDHPISAQEFIEEYNILTERLLLDVVDRFDDHVLEQNAYFKNLDKNKKIKIFVMGPDLNNQLMQYLGWQSPSKGLDGNLGDDDQNIKLLQKFFRKRLNRRPELVRRLRRHYEKDYELIAQMIK